MSNTRRIKLLGSAEENLTLMLRSESGKLGLWHLELFTGINRLDPMIADGTFGCGCSKEEIFSMLKTDIVRKLECYGIEAY